MYGVTDGGTGCVAPPTTLADRALADAIVASKRGDATALGCVRQVMGGSVGLPAALLRDGATDGFAVGVALRATPAFPDPTIGLSLPKGDDAVPPSCERRVEGQSVRPAAALLRDGITDGFAGGVALRVPPADLALTPGSPA